MRNQRDEDIIVGDSGSASAPAIVFEEDTDTGLILSTANTIGFVGNGTNTFSVNHSYLGRFASKGGAISSSDAASTTPTLLPDYNDTDTGIGADAAADTLSLITGGVEAMRFLESSSGVLFFHNISNNITADVGSSQGDGPLTSSLNVISTCANAGDAVTLPAIFSIGTMVFIKNNGAASCDVFPASGDDLGQGANTAEALGVGEGVLYVGTSAHSTWTKMLHF